MTCRNGYYEKEMRITVAVAEINMLSFARLDKIEDIRNRIRVPELHRKIQEKRL
jgi:hypothetical protein